MLLFSFGCGNPQQRIQQERKQSKYASMQHVRKLLNDQSKGFSNKTIYVIFSASWCPSCTQLRKLLRDASIEDKVTFIDIDRTWGYLFSKEMGVNGIPALAVIKSDKTIEMRDNINKILVYLLANVDKNDR